MECSLLPITEQVHLRHRTVRQQNVPAGGLAESAGAGAGGVLPAAAEDLRHRGAHRTRSHLPSLPDVQRVLCQRDQEGHRTPAQEAIQQVLVEGTKRHGLCMTGDRKEGAVNGPRTDSCHRDSCQRDAVCQSDLSRQFCSTDVVSRINVDLVDCAMEIDGVSHDDDMCQARVIIAEDLASEWLRHCGDVRQCDVSRQKRVVSVV